MDHSIFRGDSLTIDIAVTQKYEGLSKPVPLDGATIWMTAKKKASDTDEAAVFQVQTPDDIVIDSVPSTGRARITVPGSGTQALVFPADGLPIKLVYDIQVKTATGLIQTVAKGTITVKEDVTRAV